MSGGQFDYQQYKIGYIADEVEQLILNNESKEVNEYGDRIGNNYSPETIDQFKKGLQCLRLAHVYAQRIDWLASGDDSEQAFHVRLEEAIKQISGAQL